MRQKQITNQFFAIIDFFFVFSLTAIIAANGITNSSLFSSSIKKPTNQAQAIASFVFFFNSECFHPFLLVALVSLLATARHSTQRIEILWFHVVGYGLFARQHKATIQLN